LFRRVVADVDVGGSSEHAAFSTDGCASMRSCAERSVRSSESRLFSWSPSEGPWSRRPGRSSTLALGSLRSWLIVASGPLCATAGRAAEGAPKSTTESRDGTFGSFELPHQLDMVAIGPLGQEGLPGALWAPSHAPELEALSLPSRVAEASVMLMSACFGRLRLPVYSCWPVGCVQNRAQPVCSGGKTAKLGGGQKVLSKGLLRNEPQYPTKGDAPHSGRGGEPRPGGDNQGMSFSVRIGFEVFWRK